MQSRCTRIAPPRALIERRPPARARASCSVLLGNIARACGRETCTLVEVPDTYFAELHAAGFDWLYLIGCWQTGQAGVDVSREVLGPLDAPNAASSPFAIAQWRVAPELGGDDALREFVKRANRCGVLVMIDFVPNHTAADHDWVRSAPWLYVLGSADDYARYPHRYFPVVFKEPAPPGGDGKPAEPQVATGGGGGGSDATAAHAGSGGRTLYIAHGRDPHYDGWRDTAQLNMRHPVTRQAMRELLLW